MNESIDAPLIDAWATYKQHNQGRTETTAAKYAGYLQRLAKFLEEQGGTLAKASSEQLEAFTGLEAHRQGLSPRSRRAIVAAVRGFYAWMVKSGRLPASPAADLPYPNAGLKLPRALELKYAERLLMQPDISTFLGIRDAAIIATFIGCGVRVSGLVGLNESDLAFADIGGREWLILRVREKGKKERLVPAPAETRLLIRAYLGHEELERIDRTLPDGDKVLFVSTANRIPPHQYHGEARRISARSVNDLIIKHGTAAGIPRAQLHPHAMRHLYGTELAEEDVDLIVRQALLGHADPKTTSIYDHTATRRLTRIVSQANPLRKMQTPVTDLLREIERRYER